jgi:hypothetical protein
MKASFVQCLEMLGPDAPNHTLGNYSMILRINRPHTELLAEREGANGPEE